MNTIKCLDYGDGRKIEDHIEMEKNDRVFFYDLFATKYQIVELNHILSSVGKCITKEEYLDLMVPYTDEEVFRPLKSMGPLNASRINGFSAILFQICWHIVGKELSLFCLGILNDNVNLKPTNVTNIVLVHKIQNPTSMANFRPISLCNVIYKIIAKLVANRFQRVLDVCIDSFQSDFVPGRLISNNVLLAYEILHTFDQKGEVEKA